MPSPTQKSGTPRTSRSIDAGGPPPAKKSSASSAPVTPPIQNLPPEMTAASAPATDRPGFRDNEELSDKELFYPEEARQPSPSQEESEGEEESEPEDDFEESYTPEDFGYSDDDEDEWDDDEKQSLKDEIGQAATQVLDNQLVKEELSIETWIILGELLTPPVTLIGLPILSIYVYLARRDKEKTQPWLHLLTKSQEWLIIGIDLLILFSIPILFALIIYTICNGPGIGTLVTIALKIYAFFGGTNYCSIFNISGGGVGSGVGPGAGTGIGSGGGGGGGF